MRKEMTKREENLYQNLNEQIIKVFKTNKRQSRAGKERFIAGSQDFAKFLAQNYGSQNFKNIRDQHIVNYVNASNERGLSKSAIETNLSAIRKLHDLMPVKKHDLTVKNKDLNIPEAVKTEQNTDRAWTDNEHAEAVQVAEKMGREDVVNAMNLSRNFGMRVNEVTALHTRQLENGLKTGFIELTNTKNGIPRDVPVETDEQRASLQRILGKAEKGRLFIKHNHTHEKAKRSIQDFIRNNRDKFQSEKAFNQGETRTKANLTFHGLRHTYTRDQYNRNLTQGMNEYEARKDVSRNIGHGRESVTNTYL